MQEFIVTVKVTVNTESTVSEAEVYSEIQGILELGFDSGIVSVTECEEV